MFQYRPIIEYATLRRVLEQAMVVIDERKNAPSDAQEVPFINPRHQ